MPDRYVAPGYAPIKIDARIWPDVRLVLSTYHLVLTAGKETGHRSHGNGSAIDAVPCVAGASLDQWERNAERLARDLGWTPACAASGVRAACDLVPAIEFIGYNGYPGHGDPAPTSEAHVHVSWVSSTHGTPYLTTAQWLLTFPLAESASDPATDAQRAGPVAPVIGDSLTVGEQPYLEARRADQAG